MTPRKKHILIIISIVIIISGTWFYNQLYRNTGSALKLAEDFLFSRMVVSQIEESGDIRYFYASNRKHAESHLPNQVNYTTKRSPVVSYGYYDTHIKPSLGIGMIINPSEWFQNEDIRINRVRETRQEQFIKNLKEIVDRTQDRSLLIMVHGFREAFDSALRKTAFVGYILDIDSPVLLFDWPGNQGAGIRSYRRARQVATESAHELSDTLKLIIKDVKPDKIWLIANSMGGQVVSVASGILNNDPVYSDKEHEFEDIILTAPDVNQDEFDNQFKQDMASITKELTVYVSSNDRALVMSRIINQMERLGESNLNPDMLDEAVSISKLMEDGDDLITLVDVTPVNRTRNFHNYTLETPEFFDDLFLRLTNKKTPVSRRIYGLKTPGGKQYWVLTPGR